MSKEDTEWLTTQFNKMDRNGCGIVNVNDITHFLSKSHPNIDEIEAKLTASKLIKTMDSSGRGEITLEDFVRSKTLCLLKRYLGSSQEMQIKGLEMLTKLDETNGKTGQINASILEAELSRSMNMNEKNEFMKQITQLQVDSQSGDDDKSKFKHLDFDTNEKEKNWLKLPHSTLSGQTTAGPPTNQIDLKLIGYLGSMSIRTDDINSINKIDGEDSTCASQPKAKTTENTGNMNDTHTNTNTNTNVVNNQGKAWSHLTDNKNELKKNCNDNSELEEKSKKFNHRIRQKNKSQVGLSEIPADSSLAM